jgi:hypothetical protein
MIGTKDRVSLEGDKLGVLSHSRRWMMTPNPRGRDRESGRCSTTSRPKSDAVTVAVTVQRLRRNAGVTAQQSAATSFSAGAVETGNRVADEQADRFGSR